MSIVEHHHMTSDFSNTLNGIPSEHLTARKQTRLKFMKTESEQQRLYIEDLETSLALNKSMLQELFNTGASLEDTQTITFASPRIIEQLINENRRLEEQLSKAMELRNEAQGKALINEQILAECHLREQELIEEFEEKLQELKYQSDRRDRLIQELSQRNQHLESEAELYQKSKDVIILPPIEPVMNLHERVERLRTHMHKVARELHRTRTHKELLIDECRNLWSDYNKTNALLKNPVNRKLNTPRNRELSFGEFYAR
mmetsp:Transcript_29232/g.52233  ORF Transcript_29232/g.52233 Transcript_29232/m.52233 type:complete len:258 (-) Transcript_29232:565-1338(-)